MLFLHGNAGLGGALTQPLDDDLIQACYDQFGHDLSVLSMIARVKRPTRLPPHMCAMILSPNSEHLISVAPSFKDALTFRKSVTHAHRNS